KHLVDKALGYGIEGRRIDGNNILEVYHTIKSFAEEMRENPRPVLIECVTFRMRGHEEASGTQYVPQSLMQKWSDRDPVTCFENYLLEQGVLNKSALDELRTRFKTEISQDVENALNADDVRVSSETEVNDMYQASISPVLAPGSQKTEKRYLDAISDALRLGMRKYPHLVIMGQDIAEYGGAFKITEGFVEEFGKERIRNTPICESAIVGAALGLSINGCKSVVEMQFADFATCGFNQIINNLAKTYYRWNQPADVVIRMPTGAGTGAGPFHSQSNEAWFTKTPGLKVVYPAFAADAKGLLLAAIEDPNPVMYFEHKYLYRSTSELVADNFYTIEIGKARLIIEGEQFSIITYGLGVHWALEYLKQHPDLSADLLDLRSLLPWDKEAVEQTVKKTGRVLILHEDTLTCGFGAELSAYIAEHCFKYLDAPIIRCASLDTAIPMNKQLEDNFLAKSHLDKDVKRLLAY
ncbi:MAG: dehydrogenase, partial [Daejeonella sp.]|nr:dehydrogenase [Daejeonella sp.]